MIRAWFSVAVFGAAALVPLLVGDAHTADLAGGLYLACAAVGLAFVVGVAGLPSLAQGGFVAIGAIAGAHLLAHGAPTVLAAACGGLAGGAAAAVTGAAFTRLPRAGFAVATWGFTWLIALAAQSIAWVLGGSEGIVVGGGPSPAGHYELALALTALAAAGYLVLARSAFGLRLIAATEREAAARSLGVPVRRLRTIAMTAAGTLAGVTGALGAQLAVVADPSSYGPYLSFKLLVVVLLGGALAPLGAPAGVLVLGVLSVLADVLTSLEHVAASRAHALLASILLLGVVSLGWSGLVSPARARRRGEGTPPEAARTGALAATGLTKRYGAHAAVDGVSLAVETGTVTAIVGPNGSGKTTLLRLLAGTVAPDEGRIESSGDVTRTLQATAVFPSLTASEHVLVGSARRRRRAGFFRTLLATPQARREDAAFAGEAEQMVKRFGLRSESPAGELPSSDQRLLMLAAASATGAGVLLIDEPTSGLSPAEAHRAQKLLRSLRDEGRAIVVVEHNLRVVRGLADRVLVLDAGRVIADGAPAEIPAYVGGGASTVGEP